METCGSRGVIGPPIFDPRAGGGVHADLREVLPGGSPGDAPFRVGDVGSDPPHGKQLVGISQMGVAMDDCTTPPSLI